MSGGAVEPASGGAIQPAGSDALPAAVGGPSPGRGRERPGPTVLVLRALGLGDALAGVAALRGVRGAWPTAHLVLAGPSGPGELLRRYGVIDAVVPTAGLLGPGTAFDACRTAVHNAGPVRVAVNLHGCGPQSHTMLRSLAAGTPTNTETAELVAFGCPAARHDGPMWRSDEHEVDRWCRLMRHAGGTCGPEDLRLTHPYRPPGRDFRHRVIVIHPGAAAPSRRWPAERFAQVAARLRATGHRVLVTGTDLDRADCAVVARAAAGIENLCGALSVLQLADLVARADLLICGDTGPAHLATAFATRSVLLFGPTAPAHWGPRIDPGLHRMLWRECGRAGSGDPHGIQVDPTLLRIGVGEVLQAAQDLLLDVGGPMPVGSTPPQPGRRQ